MIARTPHARGGDRRSGRSRGRGRVLAGQGWSETPDITLAELQALLKERDLSVGTGTVWRFFDRQLGSALKKTALVAAEQPERPDDRRAPAGLARTANPISIPAELVFIDEPAPRPRWPVCGYRSKRGQRCRAAVPHGHWKTTTFTAGLRRDGLTAPMLLDGPMNGVAFLAYVASNGPRSHPGTG